jgi:signal transduction histidine kinase
MKRRIIVGLAALSAILVGVVVYTIVGIESATSRLERLVSLHQVELLRERFLIELNSVQSDLYLKNTRYARSIDTIVTHVHAMNVVADGCFLCHHSESVTRRLDDLRTRVHDYENSLSRVLTLRGDPGRQEAEEDAAYRIGTRLAQEIDDITTMTNARLGEQTQAAYANIDRTTKLLYILLGIAPFLATGLAIVLVRGVTRPIAALVSATRRLEGGDLSFRIEGLHGEYGKVAASFNEMARSLEESWRKMQWAEQILVLGELAGGLAHEINNPLAGIKASMEILSGNPSVSGEPKEMMVEVIRQIERIELLVKGLLDFAKPPAPTFSSVDVNDVVSGTLSLARKHPRFGLRDGRRIDVAEDFAADLPRILADPLQLQQVLLNLLLNAADAMPSGGTITARTSRDDRATHVRVAIADTGTGVDEAMLGKIFLPFFTTKAKGTGLGLATTKRLVEQHGGRISVANRASGGAEFSVVLPVSPEGAPRGAVAGAGGS